LAAHFSASWRDGTSTIVIPGGGRVPLESRRGSVGGFR
jgi:hypothetical protein